MKTRIQYKLEALERVRKLNLKNQKNKKRKSRFFSKISSGGYLVRMIKQERK